MNFAASFLFCADLDGVLLPSKGGQAAPGILDRTRALLQEMRAAGVRIAYVSGRSLTSAKQGARTFRLPNPDWWVCSSGTELFDGEGRRDEVWFQRLGQPLDQAAIRRAFYGINGLTLQHGAQQSRFTLSFQYFRALDPMLLHELRGRLRNVRADLRLSHIDEKSTGRTLIDIFPEHAGKTAALHHLASELGLPLTRVFFAGDDRSDVRALLSGVRGVLVGNAQQEARNELNELRSQRPDAHIYVASQQYGDGVIEGLKLYRFAS
ncbi:MAG: HAD-IIB family hydrolase [Chromatiales bacterium]|nr:HAD-IIB family hydrolase [Gammaproteobacteria bacterium]MCP5352312.1 HAD-IIB family hydrolase [Chromatiales bacterium]